MTGEALTPEQGDLEALTNVCPHCGLRDEDMGGPEHRACRLKAAFPGAYHQDGALVTFDMETMRKAIGWEHPVETKGGVKFTRQGGRVVVMVDVRIGNIMSSWGWYVSEEDWATVVAALPPEPRT